MDGPPTKPAPMQQIFTMVFVCTSLACCSAHCATNAERKIKQRDLHNRSKVASRVRIIFRTT
jgi:hypothetical protein